MNIGIVGASGRMGQTLIHLVNQDKDLTLAGVSDRADSDWIGRDLGEAMGTTSTNLHVYADPIEAFQNAEAIIDFSTPAATLINAETAAQIRAVHVIGTTGFSADEVAMLEPASRHSVQIRSGNMSLGVNLLAELTRQTAAKLGIEYDIEIIESHHRHKVDAPSGTALLLGEAAADGRGIELTDMSERGRDGITGARGAGAIGFSAIRGGDIIGEHDVLFAGEGERITLRHVASDRSLFARGALTAAKWGLGQSPGQYSMRDVLDLGSR